jgi:uncharacterized protein
MIAITEDIYNLVMRYKNKIDQLQKLHPTLYEAMHNKGFIVEDSLNEYKSVVDEINDQCENPSSIHITINPTMDCNFRCWYCYENHNAGSKMDYNVIANVKTMISNILSETYAKKLVLSFFGGEPLLYYKSVMVPIMTYAKSECIRLSKQLDIYITTNGFLLNKSTIQDLMEYDYVSIQVPIDGDKDNHNKVKYLKDGQGSFDKVICNLQNAVKAGLWVTVRCNYTATNIESFLFLKPMFNDFANRNNIEFSFHKIWQEDNTEVLQSQAENVMERFKSDGYSTITNIGRKGLCYADYKSNLVVNYNGDIYKCTARNFNDNNKLGTLEDYGVIIWNDKYEQRLNCKYKSADCSVCEIFPVCMQGCSQNVFEQKNVDRCVFEYTTRDKEKIVKERIKLLMH